MLILSHPVNGLIPLNPWQYFWVILSVYYSAQNIHPKIINIMQIIQKLDMTCCEYFVTFHELLLSCIKNIGIIEKERHIQVIINPVYAIEI
jgi:hypothetical protein